MQELHIPSSYTCAPTNLPGATPWCMADTLSAHHWLLRIRVQYAFMGDVSRTECALKCQQITCPCFDFSATSRRKGEGCRVCPPSLSCLPLRASGWGYAAILPRYDYLSAGTWGWAFVCGFVLLVSSYLGVGIVHGVVVKGQRGPEALPNAALWIELPGLVRDGIVRAPYSFLTPFSHAK
jgi:hypothetical protein